MIKYLGILALVVLSGCCVDVMQGGMISEDRSTKIGFISSDLHVENKLDQFEDRSRRQEAFIKEDGIVFGITYKKEF